ncbi:hybrid sensor histidine kinase/response regulator [Paenibacillus glacialis]|uniref:Circadian input-output histidine kinase CikA n=1 Tax=Paenibacillus glacialis TaxID=494026 RepID=A0A168NMV5_9BACL|nr:ATP-binding protein [Paenibacillus glacialis]OAB45949.1 histidine kinase [Paenibacillus glacialis]
MMSKRKIVLIAVMFFLVLTTLRIAWISFHSIPDHPRAEQGTIDLSQWNFSDRQEITLDGEWEFYPSLLLKPEKFKSSSDLNLPRSWIEVPGNWNSVMGTNSKYGFGTYRLRVLIHDEEQLYGIRIPNILTASRLYINGNLKQEMGFPTETVEDNKARNVPYSSSFHTDTREIEIVVHVSNYQLSNTGGIIQSIKFGTTTAVANEKLFSQSMQIIVCIVLLLHGLYACIIYVLGSREKVVFYFAGAICCMFISTLVDDDKILLAWVPLDLEWSFKLYVVSYVGASLFFMFCAINLLNNSKKDRRLRWITLLCAIFTMVFIVLPEGYFILGKVLLFFIVMIVTWLIPACILKAITKGEKAEAIVLLLSVVAISTNIFTGGLIRELYWLDMPYYPFDMIIAFLGLASFWFIRFFQTTTRAENLTIKLQKADKLKDDFLANTSHELRNPLHGMINMAQTVLEDGKDTLDEKNKSHLELITTVGRRMSLMLNDLLDITRLKEQDVQLNKQSLNLQGVVSGVFDILRFMTEGKPIELVMDMPEPFPNVMADENRLVQILFNLVHNAIKYTNEGLIVVHSGIRNDMVYIDIKDSGIGISEEEQQKIFHPYEQGDSSMTAIGGGLGLGLSICKRLVELHGGTLEVKSSLDLGSVFNFTLPIDNNTMQRPIIESERSAISTDHVISPEVIMDFNRAWTAPDFNSDVRRPKILAVDDDPVNLKILRNMLSADHYDMTVVTSGKEALICLDREEWDLIITDVMMPRMSGYELSRAIREKFTISELPILLLTARSQSEDVYHGFQSGANDYVTKPVRALELKTRVRGLIDLRQSVTEQLRMEAAWLQAQIQPHFLFNTLNTIASLSDTDTTRMVILLEKFGHYLRTSFADKNLKRVVPLDHELELLESYVYIEQERFGDRLQVVWNVQKGINIEIPPLSIQPLLENAVRHGILTRARGGTITIGISENDDYVEVSISDDGVGMDVEKVESLLISHPQQMRGIGLLNTDRRLKQTYGIGLQISSALDQGTTVSFTIPKSK